MASSGINRRQALRAMVGGVAALTVAHKVTAAPVQSVQGVEMYVDDSWDEIGQTRLSSCQAYEMRMEFDNTWGVNRYYGPVIVMTGE